MTSTRNGRLPSEADSAAGTCQCKGRSRQIATIARTGRACLRTYADLGRVCMEEIPGLYQHLVDHSLVGTWVLDPAGTTVWFTPVLCEMFGRSPAELDGMAGHELFDDQGR